jgi:hypothetical protein
MSKVKCKGTALKQYITNAFTAIAQVISLKHSGAKAEVFEADTLDNTNVGIPKEHTGRVAGGTYGGELFFDPNLAGHQAITDLLLTPADCNFQLVFADNTTWNIPGCGIGLGVTVALSDGLKADFEFDVDGITAYAT